MATCGLAAAQLTGRLRPQAALLFFFQQDRGFRSLPPCSGRLSRDLNCLRRRLSLQLSCAIFARHVCLVGQKSYTSALCDRQYGAHSIVSHPIILCKSHDAPGRVSQSERANGHSSIYGINSFLGGFCGLYRKSESPGLKHLQQKISIMKLQTFTFVLWPVGKTLFRLQGAFGCSTLSGHWKKIAAQLYCQSRIHVSHYISTA